MTVAVDTSVAVALLVQSHREHQTVVRWWSGREIALSGHALAETYSVLTRLPGDSRLAPADAARLIAARFSAPLMLSSARARNLPETLSRLGSQGAPSMTRWWHWPRESTGPPSRRGTRGRAAPMTLSASR